MVGQKFSYIWLMDAMATRIHEPESGSATQASAAVPGPSGTQGGDDDAPGPSEPQESDNGTPSPPRVRATGHGPPNSPPRTYRY